MRIIETKAYKLQELSSEAQEKAFDKFRYHEGYLSYEWYNNIFDYVKEIAILFGLEIDEIYFSGFSSQGDGACFEGDYSYRKNGLKELIKEFPTATETHRIAADLQAIQRKYFYGLSASTRQRGHYNHSGCMAVSVGQGDFAYYVNEDAESEVTDLLRQFADWIYTRLEREYDYLMSDEGVRATIEDNEYEFDEEGNRI